MGYLLDTNVVINYLDASLPVAGMQLLNAIVDEEPIVSVVTKMETLGFNFKSVPEQNAMETFIDGSAVLDINNDIVNKTIAIRKNKKNKPARCHYCRYGHSLRTYTGYSQYGGL